MDCPICMNHFTGTSGIHVRKVFSCGHSICEACLTALRAGENVECPLCRAVTAATEISTNYALCSLLDVTAASANSANSVPPPSAPPATAFTSLSPGQPGQSGQALSQTAQQDMSAVSCFEHGTHFYFVWGDLGASAEILKNQLYMSCQQRERERSCVCCLCLIGNGKPQELSVWTCLDKSGQAKAGHWLQ